MGGYVILFTIYYFDGVKYTASGIDTAATGLPLLVVAICRLYSTSRLKIDGKPVRKAIFYYSLVTILLFLSLSSVVLLETSKGNLDFYHALWIQITILCVSLYFYVEVARVNYFAKSGVIAWSSIHRYIFSDSGNDLYERTRAMAIKYNAKRKHNKINGK